MEDHATSPVATQTAAESARVPRNKGKPVGAKPPLRPSPVWSIRTKLQIEGKKTDLAVFNLQSTANCAAATWSPSALMTWLRAATRWIAAIRQKKTGRPVRFELTNQTRQAIDEYLASDGTQTRSVPFTGRGDRNGLTTRQYARLVQEWVASIGLDPAKSGTHSLRRTKAVLI
jgi:hypothetical protein